MRKTLILTVIMLGGCATAKQIPLPDGRTGYAISGCDEMAECYKKAATTCGGKYELVSQSGNSIGMATAMSGFVVPTYTMTIRCEDKPAQ